MAALYPIGTDQSSLDMSALPTKVRSLKPQLPNIGATSPVPTPTIPATPGTPTVPATPVGPITPAQPSSPAPKPTMPAASPQAPPSAPQTPDPLAFKATGATPSSTVPNAPTMPSTAPMATGATSPQWQQTYASMTPALQAATDATLGDQQTAAALEAKHASGQDLTPAEWAQLNAAVNNTNAAFAPIFASAKPAPAPMPSGPPSYLVNGQTYNNFNDAVAAEPKPGMTPSGPANDVGTPASSTGAGSLLGSYLGQATTPATPTTQTTGQTPGAPYALTPTDPNNPLSAQTITAMSPVDRYKVAESQLQTLDNQLQPYFQRDLRTATENGAAKGQVGSGMLRSSLGDVVNNYANERSTAGQNFLDNALLGSIDDARFATGVAQQQQGFQNTQQQEAFNNALQQLLVGSSGDPSQLLLALSGIYSGQAGAGASAAAQYGANSTANQTSADRYRSLLPYLTGGSAYTPDPTTQSILTSILTGGVPGVQTIGSYQ